MKMHSKNLVYGYGDGEFNPQDKIAQDTMYCKFEQATGIPFSFETECTRTAETIAREAAELGRTPVVLLSGGLDSEVVAKAFQLAGVNFETITYRFANDLNKHEMAYVKYFVEQNKIAKHSYFDIDIVKFANSEHATELFTNSFCSYFEMIPPMLLMQHVVANGGYPVLGNGEALLFKNPDRSWSYIEYEYDLAWYRFQRHYQLPGSMGFFQHTADQTFAMLNEEQMRLTAAGRNRTANVTLPHSRMIKYAVYRKYWPALAKRPKYDGGELVRSLFKPLDKKLAAGRTLTYDDKWLMPAPEFFKLIAPPSHSGEL